MFLYHSGEQVRSGDCVAYHGEPGKVEFVVTEKVGESASDWYLEKFPAGGFMIATGAFGKVFLSQGDEDLEFISRN